MIHHTDTDTDGAGPGVHPLDGDVVVDLSSGIPGGYCTKLMADAGARVIKVESAEGDPLRRWSASGTEIADDDDGVLFEYVACSKESIVVDVDSAADIDFVLDLIERAGMVVWSPGSAVSDHPALRPNALRERVGSAVVVAITDWGLEGPWADRPATEFTLQAWTGSTGIRGTGDRPPVSIGGRTGEWATGTAAATSLLTARLRQQSTGTGELVDVSMFDTMVLTHGMLAVPWFTIAGFPLRPGRNPFIPEIERTSDGYVGLGLVSGQQWLDFCTMIGRQDWLEDQSLIQFRNRIDRREELVPYISEWMSQRTTADVIELATALRIPVSPIGNGKTLPELEQLRDQRWFVENPRAGFIQPRPPYRLGGGATLRPYAPAPRLGEHTDLVRARPPQHHGRGAEATSTECDLPLTGMRVAEFAAMWAGPIVGQFAGKMGAEVIHIEAGDHPDGTRMQTFKPMSDDEWWEQAPLFQAVNTDKLGLSLDLSTADGVEVAKRLVEHCDVVIDNYTPRVMEQFGLDYEVLREIRPDVIMVRAPAFGLAGPWRDRGGYSMTLEQASGLAWLTGHPDGPMFNLMAVMDPLAAMQTSFALLLALEHRRRTGQGMLIESPMLGAAVSIAAEQIVEYSANGVLLERMGNRGPNAAPQNLYLTVERSADGVQDDWVAIAVASDEQWIALRKALDEPAWMDDPALFTEPGRRAAHDAIDERLGAWCAERTADEIVDRLWPAGVPVAKVLLSHQTGDNPQLQFRGYWEVTDHPVTGEHLLDSWPARFSGGPTRFNRHHAPKLGEDNEHILHDVLGLPSEEIHRLNEKHVAGGHPPLIS